MFFGIGLVLGIIGIIPIFFADAEKAAKGTAIVILGIIYTLLGWWILWGMMPSIAYPLFGGYSFIVLIWWIVSAAISCSLEEGFSKVFFFPIGLAVIFLGITISGSDFFNTTKYASLIGKFDTKNQKHWSQEVQPLDPTHLRLMPDSAAIHLAKTVVSQDGNSFGSQYPLSTEYTTLQKIKSDYYYLIPMDFKGWRAWTSSDGVPGYVKISATDPNATPILVTNKKMKYMPNACFGTNLERALYQKYYNKVLTDYSFEEDDNGNVFWVTSVCKPSIAYWGDVLEGVSVLDPETGNEEFVSLEKLESDPKYAWIDRAMPTEMVSYYVNRWGELKDGWWNAAWTHMNILESETPTINYSKDGRCMFVVPVTSNNDKDEAMTGLMYCDARTGKFLYYTTSGGGTESDIIQAVNAAVAFKKWTASNQIVFENVYGHLAALVPVLGGTGTYQGLAIVRNDNRKVAFGTTPQEALIEFQKIVMSAGGQITTESTKDALEFKGIVARIGWDLSSTGKQYYLYFAGISHSFMVSSLIQSELALTKEGDQVYIQYINSNQASMPVISFRNLTLNLQVSANESSVNTQMTQRKDSVQEKKDVKDFKEEVKTMSDDDLKKLMKKNQK